MNKIKTVIYLILLILASCAPKKTPLDQKAKDIGFVTNVYGQAILWKNYPIKLIVSKSVPKEFYPDLQYSINAWNESSKKTLFTLDFESESSTVPLQDGKNVIYFLKEWDASRDSEQGRTSVYWVGSEINEVDIRINLKDFTYFSKNSLSSTMPMDRHVEINSLLIHELGHTLGVSHLYSKGSVMNTNLDSNLVRVNFSKEDVSLINFLVGYLM